MVILAAFSTAPARASPANILIVVLDGCRPDKLSCYGFERTTTPALDRFSRDSDSVVFERHYVQGNWTKPSTASLFTGLFVSQHRVNLDGLSTDPGWRSSLGSEVGTIAETFRDAGYSTWGLATIPHLDERFGFARGFETYELLEPGDRGLLERSLELAREAERPFFGYVHFIACHHPYWRGNRNRDYLSRYQTGYREDERRLAGIDFTDPGLAGRINQGIQRLSVEDVDFLHLVYEATLREFDRAILAKLFDQLAELGLFDQTLVVVTADHGEELYEHGGLGHGYALWEEIVRVPLIVKFPRGRRPTAMSDRWQRVSRAIDLYPTLTSFAGLALPEMISGRDLTSTNTQVSSVSESKGLRSMVDGRQKLMLARGQHAQLFDLGSRAGERLDLAGVRSESVERLLMMLKSEVRSAPLIEGQDPTTTFSSEQLDALRALGYID